MVRGRKPPRDRGRHFRSEKDVSEGSGDEKKDEWGPRRLVQRNLDLPPGSDSEGEEEGPAPPSKEEIKIKVVPVKEQPRDKKAEDSSEEEESSDDDALLNNEYLRAPARREIAAKAAKAEVKVSAKQAAADISRLEAIRKKREDDRLKRIQQDGWDRFAPVSESNHPPAGYVPPPPPKEDDDSD